MEARKMWTIASMMVIVLAGACGGNGGDTDVAPATEPEAPVAMAVDPATAGNITGIINLEGTAPEAEVIRMNSDPVCAGERPDNPMTEYYVVGDDGSLHNVFVYVKEGLEGHSFPTPSEPVILNQDGCTYLPHVFGIQVDQALHVINSDPTLHNIHATPSLNDEFNTGQPIEGMTYETEFSEVEVMVPFKCDVHGWMNSYVGVLDHPYYSVSGDGGAFSLNTLPPGDYVIEAWHEMLGAQTQNITIAEGETAEISFTFTIS